MAGEISLATRTEPPEYIFYLRSGFLEAPFSADIRVERSEGSGRSCESVSPAAGSPRPSQGKPTAVAPPGTGNAAKPTHYAT